MNEIGLLTVDIRLFIVEMQHANCRYKDKDLLFGELIAKIDILNVEISPITRNKTYKLFKQSLLIELIIEIGLLTVKICLLIVEIKSIDC